MTGSDNGRDPACTRARNWQATPNPTLAVARCAALLCCAGLLAGCSGADTTARAKFSKVSPTLGVSASPRVHVTKARRTKGLGTLPKGGGSRKIGKPYKIAGRWYTPHEDPTYNRVGIASWYGSDFHGRLTANGEIYDMNALTAAHKTLPLPSYAYVTNPKNNRTVLVRINDRGPYAGNRIIDLSRATARALGLEQKGVGQVRVQFAGPAPLDGNDYHERRFLASQSWARPRRLAATQRNSSQSRRPIPNRRVSRAQTSASWDPHRYRRSLGRQ